MNDIELINPPGLKLSIAFWLGWAILARVLLVPRRLYSTPNRHFEGSTLYIIVDKHLSILH
jgi:hypothetical protein